MIRTATLLFLMMAAASPAFAEADNSAFAELLDKSVQGRVVDYAGIKSEEYKLDAYLDMLANVDVDDLDRDEELAFWINAYNAWTVKLVLRDYPDVESIKDYGGLFTSPWEIDLVRAAGDLYSLDEVEHGIIRRRFDEPRIHFAVNCASVSCPKLRSEPYTGAKLDRQLDDQAKDFINNEKLNRFQDGALYLSSIFKWYAEDFEPPGVVDYIRRFARGAFRTRLEAAGADVDVEYLDYDWSLNGKRAR
jgi:hypothetical protein